jgi:CheY-like chemotaxis protein
MTDLISKSRRRIVTVNCNAGLRMSLGSILDGAGYEVGHAFNGSEAAQMHRSKPFDAAIIEIVTLERDGLETLVQLTSQPSPPKFVAMAEADRLSAELYLTLARHLGVRGAIAKPSQLGQMLETVRGMLGEAC